MTIIKTKDFVLRPIRMSDAKAIYDAQIDKVARKGFMSTPKNINEVKKSIRKDLLEYKKKKPSSDVRVIEVDGECAGWVAIHDLNKEHHEHKGIVGYCLHKKFRGRGITARALKLFTKYAFKKYKLKRISGWCRTFNKASARTMEKAGYKLEGIMRKNKKKNGKYLDDMIWAKVK
jgi:ribosomal-protein-alanine N-acetyltransferase